MTDAEDDPALVVVMRNFEAMKRGLLSLWTVYEKPLDHPEGFIARRFESGQGRCAPTMDTVTGDLEAIRSTLERAGLVKLARESGDEPQIVETWV